MMSVFTSINQHQSFVASLNIIDPSLDFFDSKGERIATWKFDKSYTGATLIPYDRLVLYGHQLNEIDIYELSTGKLIQSIETGIGTTNAYYDQEEHYCSLPIVNIIQSLPLMNMEKNKENFV